ncbi:MAG: glycosyltransferase [Clostridia bacterium]|nr:glycosyltransferase [Clostridia bacterium]
MIEFPGFSVLLSLYIKENPDYFKASIDSILKQTLLPNEIVIVLDGPITEELNNILEEYCKNPIFKVIRLENNVGLGLALKTGVENCSYDIIARMDTDDICREDRFEKQIAFLVNNRYDAIGSNTAEFMDSLDNIIDTRIMPETSEQIKDYSRERNPFVHPSVVFYKSAVLEVGNYRSKYLCEDYDLWTRLIENGFKLYNIQENLVYMRISKDFYKRRGGLKYCKHLVDFKKELYKRNYMTRKQYLKTKTATIVSSIIPTALRKRIYTHFLRNKVKK